MQNINFSDSCKLDYYADIEYGDDKIYVGYANNKVEAFDADTLKPVWISEDTGHSVTSKMTYKNKKSYILEQEVMEIPIRHIM